MSLVPVAPSLRAAQLAARIAPLVDVSSPMGAVTHVLRPGGRPRLTSRQLARYAELVAGALDRPLFRLSPEDLAAPPVRRTAALLALVDAAQVAGAVLLVDAAETLAPDPAAAAAVRLRLGDWDGGVVLLATDRDEDGSDLVDVVTGTVTVRRVA